MATKSPSKIDVHHHILPEFFHDILANFKSPVGLKPPPWSEDSSIELMDKLNISTAILSLSAPGALIAGSPAANRALVRKWNDYAFSLCESHPGRFGFFAALPSLTDSDGCLTEIKYAFETLRADGVTLFTSYEGKYLGASEFGAVWQMLEEYGAVVHVHPIHSKEAPFSSPFLPQPLIDYPHETARTASDLILSGRKSACPKCRIILSHAGGTLPALAERLAALATTLFRSLLTEKSPRGKQIIDDAKSFYFDLALGGSANVLDSLLRWAPKDKILFGSDFPYASQELEYFTGCLEEYEMKDEIRAKCYRENALALFPRLKE